MAISAICLIITALCILLAVGYFTLLERKVLAYIQRRRGPDKVGIIAIPQPLADAVKLFAKEFVNIICSNKNFFNYRPLIAIIIIFTLWSLYNSTWRYPQKWGVLFFITISSLNVYAIIIAGWSRNSKYALLGSVRAVAQTISYEISIGIILVSICIALLSMNLQHIIFSPIILIIVPIWLTICLAETNRAPFDLAEGESELVSGFNIEYGRALFAFLFIAEYGNILFMRMITCQIFFATITIISPLLLTISLACTFLWVRGTFPRIRYDQLMALTWKRFLPLSLAYILTIF